MNGLLQTQAKPPRNASAAAPARSSFLQRKCACGGTPGPSGECEECRKKKLQRKTRNSELGTWNDSFAPPIVHEALRSPGQPLDGATRAFMEPRFNHDFSGVRVHTDSRAADSARAVNALAYTVGQQVAFGEGQYAPTTGEGRRLLAHELTHVVQQAHEAPNMPMASAIQMNAPGDAYEQEADAAAQTIMEHPDRGMSGVLHARPMLQRKCGSDLGPPVPACVPMNGDRPGEIFQFRTNCDDIIPSELAHVTRFLAGLPAGTTLTMHGYATPDGPALDAFNWRLSCHRANAMAGILRSAMPTFPITNIFAHGPVAGPASMFQAVWVESPTPPTPAPPTPAPPTPAPPTPAPRFVCGPNVTTQVRDAVSTTKTTFAGWTATQKEDACHALNSLLTGGFAWDIVDLHNNAWILTYRPACATAGATPPCGSSVQIDSDCHYAGSANYVIFGVMCDLCQKHFTAIGSSDASDYSESEMLDLINKYKGTGFTGFSTPSANFVPSQNWASAGFHGWPAVASPAGDRSGCSPSCPTPYAGAAFMVNWVPIGVF